jgi:hypothetical protein
MIDQYDDKTRRCPMLGHEIEFSYCRMPGKQVPCSKIYDCWWERFDIAGFMQAHYPPEIIAEILKPKQAKVATLFEIIQSVQKRTDP